MSKEFLDAISWLDNHQTFSPDDPNVEIADISHPQGDGDGFATRVFRISEKIVPLILGGRVVRLSGGFRGYTDATEGFTSLFRPFCREDETNTSWQKFPPENIIDKDYVWWMGVVIFYFLRPVDDIQKYIDNLRPAGEFLGIHLRYGDNHYGLRIGISKYIQLSKMFHHEYMYIATDSSAALEAFSGFQNATYQKDALSIDMSRPGTSAAGILIRNETQKWIRNVSKEVIADILLLSEAKILIGLSVSKITTLAKLIGLSRGNLTDIVEL